MHPLQMVFILICLTLLAYGVLWCAEQIGRRVRRQSFSAPPHPVGAPSGPTEAPSRMPSEVASTALDGSAPADRDGLLILTPVDIVRGLASVKRIDSDGNATWLSKERIAAVAGMRAVDARAIIDEVRGTDPAPKPAANVTPHAGRPYNPAQFRDEPEAV